MRLTILALVVLSAFPSVFAQKYNASEVSIDNDNEELPSNSIFVGGIQMNEGDQRHWVNTVKNVGMNTVEVTIYAHQGRWNENNLWYYEDEPAVVEEIKMAKAAGLHVVLILRLQLDHAFSANHFLWHGSVFPENDYLVQRWFEEYTRFAKKWAIISEREGVEVFVIGSELSALFATRPCTELPDLESYYLSKKKQQDYHKGMMSFKKVLTEDNLYTPGFINYTSLEKYLNDEINCKEKWAKVVAFSDSVNQLDAINLRRSVQNWYWEHLIEGMREVYTGKMTIAANFDNYQEIAFWDKLDFIGINAYFPLRELSSKRDMASQIRNSWDSILDEINAFKEANKLDEKPVLFTEIGYGRHSGSTLNPWQGFGFSLLDNVKSDSLIIWENQKTDQAERNLALSLLYECIEKKNFPIAGLLYWKLTSKKEQLKYDPFALHIGTKSDDNLQEILVNFLELDQTESSQKE
ncbi:MAG: hypothetical protein ACI837_000799 [Crocinitomicaceae bacterium]|jgi:hypothetical protein